MILRSISRNHI